MGNTDLQARVKAYVNTYYQEHDELPSVGKVKGSVTGKDSTIAMFYREYKDSGEYKNATKQIDTQKIKEKVKEEPKKETKKIQEPIIIGIKAGDKPDMDAIWQAAFKAQDAVWEFENKRKGQAVELPNEASVIAIIADTHFGSAGTDYKAAKKDAELVRDNENVFAIYNGDGINNYIVSKLTLVNSDELFSIDTQWQMLEDYLEHFRGKLIACTAGNHNMWTKKLAGFDHTKNLMQSFNSLYDPDEIVFNLTCGDFSQIWKVRHKWKYSSIYNPTHAVEVGYQRGDVPFDVGIMSHTHSGTFVRSFLGHGKKRYACLTGAYKKFDKYGVEQGFNAVPSNGCAAFVITPDGLFEPFDNIETAIKFRDAL
jgi:hypothetical protein